jgi:hypothetical protein
MKEYCNRNGGNIDEYRFTYDGNRIQGTSTAKEIGLEEGDVIDVLANQIGG